MKYKDFENEDIEQLNEKELDEFILCLGNFLEECKAQSVGVYAQVPEKILQIKFCKAVLNKIAHGNNLTIKTEFHKPIESMGNIMIEGSTISFEDMKWLCRVAEFSDNTEIYPLANGNTRMTFTFHGLLKKIG